MGSLFASTEARGGAILIAAAALALIVANGPLAPRYFAWLAAPIGPLDVHHWINDALMALFFLAVGLEVKREFLAGELRERAARPLPIVAAAAGMAVPALVYLAIAGGAAPRGWAIPAATDIAFAQGVLALAGARVAPSLRLFLTTVAIVDDIGAVAIIALAYTPALAPAMLAAAAAILLVMALLNRRGVDLLWPYLLLGALLWVAVYRSGVHATVAGVLAALTIPLVPGRSANGTPPLQRLETRLHPIVAYGIVPLFGFANAGVALGGLGWAEMLAPVPLGIAVALFAGKQAGVLLGIGTATRFGWATMPAGASARQLYGVATLCGIGFTMSLFIGDLAFADPLRAGEVKLGVLGGSLASAVVGFAILSWRGRRPG